MKLPIKDRRILKKIQDLCRFPERVIFTRRAQIDIAELSATSTDVLDAIKDHIDKGKDVHFLIQRETQLVAYTMIIPISCTACYVKVQIDTNHAGEILIVISCHP